MAAEAEYIDQSSDDAFETNLGAVDTTDDHVKLSGLLWGGGFRFNNVDVPQGATIDSATLKVWFAWKCSAAGNCSTTIYGVDADDTSTWNGNKPSDQDKTTASVSWSEDTDQVPDDVYSNISHNVKTIVQEIVDRGGWAADNSMSFVFDNGSFGRGNFINVYAWDNASIWGEEALLTINYTAPDTKFQINISDSWKTVPAMQIQIGDAWKAVAGAQINIGDNWKTIF
jgi:hypothetical protein